jgi:hypothetical protein
LRATEVGDDAAAAAVWMFLALGAQVGDELVDVYGLGRITEAWRPYAATGRHISLIVSSWLPMPAGIADRPDGACLGTVFP